MMTARKYWEMALAAADPLQAEGQQRVEVSALTEGHLWQTSDQDGRSGASFQHGTQHQSIQNTIINRAQTLQLTKVMQCFDCGTT